ncbi:PH domain-containing protein [Xylanimonas oleitrophica]|uniref:PH domain-containing protein n=1 Tax=Xylanimonas oleitrophica TaxID=2607479 RepID=A0A2W5WNF9_9MICO|nr:PH domain-containing protein [Xylanimonas oleitrophica]PZR52293.1 PH domain-containing protein [Xylanimonas oleitrophica]
MLPEPRVPALGNPDLRRYVLDSEEVVLATRKHWASLLEPVATTVAAFLVVGSIVAAVPPGLQEAAGWLWVAWFVALGRLAFKWLEWRHVWFVATDKRLLLLYGLVIHKVAMMPLRKVTDMGYSRTPVGQVLGYGRFVMESAGQDQALRQVDYVPRPDATYRTLCAEIFLPSGSDVHDDGTPVEQSAPPPRQQTPRSRPLQRAVQAPARPAPAPRDGARSVVVVPGRARREGPRPTTQHIAVPPPPPAPPGHDDEAPIVGPRPADARSVDPRPASPPADQHLADEHLADEHPSTPPEQPGWTTPPPWAPRPPRD